MTLSDPPEEGSRGADSQGESSGIPVPDADPAPPPKRRRSRWKVAIGGLLIFLLVILAAGAGAGYFVARPWAAQLQAGVERDLLAGADELQRGTDSIHKANQDHNPALLDEATAHFTESRSRFLRASTRLRNEWAVQKAEQVPWLGPRYLKPRVAIVGQVAAMGAALDDAGTDTAAVDRELLAPASKDQHGGERLIGVLNSTTPALDKIRADLERAQTAAAGVDPVFLPAGQRKTFAKTREQIKAGLDGIAEFQRLSPVLLEILGANGARTYLIEQADPAELRGAGGFIGSYTLLSADHGNLKLGKSGDVGLIDRPYPSPGNKKYIAPPASSRQFTDHGLVFGDSNFSSDFPTSARAGEQTFQNETGTKVDGVISIDPDAVAALLGVTGPIAIPEYNTTAEASTFAEQVFQREENLSKIVIGKKNFFPAVADRLIDGISNLPTDKWPGLLNVLNGSVEARHLQVYFNNETVETEMGRINWAGTTVKPAPDQELMLEVESNFGANKSNHFVERSYDLALTETNGKLHHHLTINLKNQTPDGYEGGRHYSGYLRFYYPISATDLVVQGLTPDRFPSDEKPTGAKLADGWFDVEITSLKLGFATHQVVIDYTTDLGDAKHGREIYWQKQAGTGADKVHISYKVDGKTFTVDTDLSQDRLLTLTTEAVTVRAGHVPAAHLPILGT